MSQQNGFKKALITGITGQDGSYLAEQLIDKGYEVHGIIRRTSSYVRQRIDHLTMDPSIKNKKLFLHYGDMTDGSNISRIVEKIMPDEVYNLAAQSVTEDCLCPIMMTNKIKYRTLKHLWDHIAAKEKEKRIENCDGIEVEVFDIPDNKQIRALGYWNGMGTWFPIKQISRHRFKGKIAKLSQKFGSVKVTPNHSLLDLNQQVKMPVDNPWMLNIRKLNYQQDRIIKNVKFPMSRISKFVDKNWFYDEEMGSPGYLRPEINTQYGLKGLVVFLGAFISEGHTTFNKANGNYYIGISNQDKNWLEKVQNSMAQWFDGKTCFVKHKKEGFEDVWELQIKSRALYRVLRKWCGTQSIKKRIPSWIFQLSDENKVLFLNTLVEGDGNLEHRKTSEDIIRYTTSSYELACQLSLIFTMCGYDYTIHEEINDKNNAWHIRQCNSYQPNQGESGKKITWEDYDGWVYDISVDQVQNFTVGPGNIVVHNSHVKISFDVPEYSAQVDGIGTIRILDALRELCPTARFYQASTSELFGLVQETPQRETTPFYPRSPYAAAKLYAFWITKNYREAYGMFACNGILFNHEGERRGENFVTKKISGAAARIVKGQQEKVSLGNLAALRDWGYAPDYTDAMWRMLQHTEPMDLVIATGEQHSVEEFCLAAFKHAGMPLEFNGDGIDRKGYDENGIVRVDVNPEYFRPTEVETLLGDPSKAKEVLGWEPTTKFDDLVRIMVQHDLDNI